ncbi:armadillo-type protein, partial [Chytridium lagenaria]
MAVNMHNVGNVYGRLCQKLSEEPLISNENEGLEKYGKWSQPNFTDALSFRERFQRLHEMSFEERSFATSYSIAFFGIICLICGLFDLRMIKEDIIHSCVQQLLSKMLLGDPEEEETKCLCKLFFTVGERLDHAGAKYRMDVYFSRIEEFSANINLSDYVKLLIRDLIEMRHGGWRRGPAQNDMLLFDQEDKVPFEVDGSVDVGNYSRSEGDIIVRHDVESGGFDERFNVVETTQSGFEGFDVSSSAHLNRGAQESVAHDEADTASKVTLISRNRYFSCNCASFKDFTYEVTSLNVVKM